MLEITYLVLMGVSAISAVLFLTLYITKLRAYSKAAAELADLQVKHNDLQSTLLDEHSKAHQARLATEKQQKRSEGQYTELQLQYAALEREREGLQAQIEQMDAHHAKETAQLRETITTLEANLHTLQEQLAHETAQWQRTREHLELVQARTEEQLQESRAASTAQAHAHEQNKEVWERDRLALQIQMNAMEDNMTLQKARFSGATSTDQAQLIKQVQDQAAAELQKQHVSWEEERHQLQQQMDRLQAERRALREQLAASGIEADLSSARLNTLGGMSNNQWQALLEEEQAARLALEEKLAAREQLARRERAALETEIEQLMERLLRLQG